MPLKFVHNEFLERYITQETDVSQQQFAVAIHRFYYKGTKCLLYGNIFHECFDGFVRGKP